MSETSAACADEPSSLERLPSGRRRQRRDQRNRGGGGRDADGVPDEPAAERDGRRSDDACGETEGARGQREQRDHASQQRPHFRLARARELHRPVRKLAHEQQSAGDQGGGGVNDVRVAQDERAGIAGGDEHERRRNGPRPAENERDDQHHGASQREEAERRLLERGLRRQGEGPEDCRDAGP